MTSSTNSAERPVTAILSSIFVNVQEMVRAEFRLANAEAQEGLGELTRGAGAVTARVLTAFFAVSFLLAAAFIALSYLMPHWNAAVIIAGVLLTMTGAFFAVYSSLLTQAGSGALSTLEPESRSTT